MGYLQLSVKRVPFFGSADSAVVGSSGLEPPTSRLSGARSNQLSYEPIVSGTFGLAFRVKFFVLVSPFRSDVLHLRGLSLNYAKLTRVRPSGLPDWWR